MMADVFFIQMRRLRSFRRGQPLPSKTAAGSIKAEQRRPRGGGEKRSKTRRKREQNRGKKPSKTEKENTQKKTEKTQHKTQTQIRKEKPAPSSVLHRKDWESKEKQKEKRNSGHRSKGKAGGTIVSRRRAPRCHHLHCLQRTGKPFAFVFVHSFWMWCCTVRR